MLMTTEKRRDSFVDETSTETIGTNTAAGVVSINKPPAVKTKRLNVNLPGPVFGELEEIADQSGRSLTEVVRLALGLLAHATDAQRAGHRLAVVDSRGKLLKELVLSK
jgi:hypothetical protein